MSLLSSKLVTNLSTKLRRLFPPSDWARGYGAREWRQDLLAGVVVVFITVPQVIAYALLAGMPAEAGLYAALMALGCYALLGSSPSLAVGPTALIAMMTFEAALSHATPGSEDFRLVAMQLALITGAVLVLLRLVNFGAVVSFLSHAVVTGFIAAAAILIIVNQVPSLLGLPASPDTSLGGALGHVAASLGALNEAALLISVGALLLLVFCTFWLAGLLAGAGLGASAINSLVKSGPMYVVLLGALLVWALGLEARVAVVGSLPGGLPSLQAALPDLARLQQLLPSALLIALVVFMESTAIGTALAGKSRRKVDANQELLGLGAANVGASLVGGFPVAGSFARSVVNFSAGAVTPVASLVTAAGVLVTLLFADAFHYLPKAALSAIIVMSAWQLVDFAAIGKIFRFNWVDSVTFGITFLAVLTLGVEPGVLLGIAVSFVLLIRESSRPHIAVVGRLGDTEHFRNVERYPLAKASPQVLAVRVDESLYFVNTRYIEAFVLNRVAESQCIKHLLLICNSTNFIDTSGLELLEELSDNLHEAGVTLHLAEVKGPVMDKLKQTDFYRNMRGKVYLSTDIAMKDLA